MRTRGAGGDVQEKGVEECTTVFNSLDIEIYIYIHMMCVCVFVCLCGHVCNFGICSV